jgi:hypothetical protein
VVDSVWSHRVLPQGWSASPAIARHAMDITFETNVLENFIESENLSFKVFPFSKYGGFLKMFVDDLSTQHPFEEDSSRLC